MHADNVAASCVIKKYDGKVRASKISEYDKLLYDLCAKHKITYIDNDCINQPLLVSQCLKNILISFPSVKSDFILLLMIT